MLNLWQIKLLHTAVWAVFAAAVLAIPAAVWLGDIGLAQWLSGLVWLEVAILVANRLRCPLTAVAARYTADRADNFDIFLPLWLARYNKHVFGGLFAAGELLMLWRILRP